MPLNHYTILGIDAECDFLALKKAYYRRAKECHPDRHGNSPASEEEFKRVVEAFNVLSDPEKRIRFDQEELLRNHQSAATPINVPGAMPSVMDSPGDDDLEELITGNNVPMDTTLSRLMLDLANTEVFITFREGKNLFFQHKYKAARICFLQTVTHSPGNILYHCFLARTCAELHDFAGAVREYRLTIALGLQRTPPQELARVKYEFEQLKLRRSPWWYRIYLKLFPTTASNAVDTRQNMIEETNRSIARLAAERKKPPPPRQLNK